MPIITNIVCDRCKMCEGVAFDFEVETWGDMLMAIRSFGYDTEGGPDQRSILVTKCPRCPSDFTGVAAE